MNLLPQLLLVAGSALWGLGWIPLQLLADRGLTGMPLVLLTYSLLGVLALPVIWVQRRQWAPQSRQLLAIALFGGWATAALVSALAGGQVVRVMLLFYLAPVWSMLGSWLLLGERLTALRLAALALAVVGIALTLGLTDEVLRPLEADDWMALSAGLAFSLNNLATRAAERVPLASKSLAAFVGSALVGAVLCVLLEQAPPPVDFALGWRIALLAVGWFASMALVQYGLTHIEAGRAALLVIVELVVAVLSSAWLGEREILPREWLGAALITAAALIAAWPQRSAPVRVQVWSSAK